MAKRDVAPENENLYVSQISLKKNSFGNYNFDTRYSQVAYWEVQR